MNSVAELVFEQVRSLPEAEVRQVLDFVGYLQSKHRTAEFAEGDEAADWAEFEKHAPLSLLFYRSSHEDPLP